MQDLEVRELPNSPAAEATVLGAILIDKTGDAVEIAATLEPDYFLIRYISKYSRPFLICTEQMILLSFRLLRMRCTAGSSWRRSVGQVIC